MKSLNFTPLDTKTGFISIKGAAFHLNGGSYHRILANILSHQFVRKLFSNGKLTCFSRDGGHSTSGKLCLSCDHPLCRSWLRLFLEIEADNYALDLPQRLIPVYKRFLDSARINTASRPFNVLATFSLEPKDGIWIFSIHKA